MMECINALSDITKGIVGVLLSAHLDLKVSVFVLEDPNGG